jgi:hypothetical protein
VQVLPWCILPDYPSAPVPQYFGRALMRAVQMFDGELTAASSTLVRLTVLKRPGALLEPKLLGVLLGSLHARRGYETGISG